MRRFPTQPALRAARRFAPVAALLLAGACARAAETAASPAGETSQVTARNVVIFIGDGMGPEHVKAASLYLGGREGLLVMESLPHRASVTTSSASQGRATDSAAAGTAIATGHKVSNGVVSLATPGSGARLVTMLEHFKSEGRATGLVTTCPIVDATPAAFGSHAPYRRDSDKIVASMFGDVKPNVLLGDGTTSEIAAREAGYVVVKTRKDLEAVPATARFVSGQFGEGSIPYEGLPGRPGRPGGRGDPYAEIPHLSEMTAQALRILSRSQAGFFLMVEGGQIDHAAHGADAVNAIGEILELDRSLKVGLDWAKDRTDTLILVTADHETGGLRVEKGRDAGEVPDVRWTTGGHTSANVPLFAWGVGAAKFAGTLDNTAIFERVTGRAPYPPGAEPGAGTKGPAGAGASAHPAAPSPLEEEPERAGEGVPSR